MKVLELFCGTGSVSKICDNLGWECISVDINDKLFYKELDYKIDILKLDYENEFEIGEFDIIWASPPCASFSSMLNIHKHIDIEKRMKEVGLPLLYKAREIIDYLKPKYYFIENPLYSKIWKYVENEKYLKKFIIVDYCSFGFDYKKPTKILTNRDDLENKRCTCNKKHICRVGINSKKEKTEGQIGEITKNVLERYAIPQPLLQYVFT